MSTAEFKNKIIAGDILKTLAKIPNESVDMAFADPPFNLKKKYGNYKDSKEVREYLDWCYKWLDEMVRIVKPTGSILVHNIPKWLTYYAAYLNEKAYFRHWIAWDAVGAPMGKTLLPNHYGILFYVKQPKGFKFFDLRTPHRVCRECGAYHKDYGGKKALMHPFGTIVSDVWSDIHRIRHKKRRDEHPCQLPEHLLERLILMTTEVDDLVLDPFIGTGTTAIAAKKLGRNYIGIDIDPKYTNLAEQKLKNVISTKINGCFVSMFIDKVVTIRDKDYKLLERYIKQKQPKVKFDLVTESSAVLPLFGNTISLKL